MKECAGHACKYSTCLPGEEDKDCDGHLKAPSVYVDRVSFDSRKSGDANRDDHKLVSSKDVLVQVTHSFCKDLENTDY
eukprot:scaffold900_cov399-Pavlova_lutheri.AAC.5